MNILSELKKGVTTRSPEETGKLGKQLVSELPEDSIIALHGDLGSGKTTLVKGIARGLKISNTVTSPTFSIYTLYSGTRQLLHIDAYRLASCDDLENLCIEEFLQSPYVLVIEWPENIPGFMDHLPRIDLWISILSSGEHAFRLGPITS